MIRTILALMAGLALAACGGRAHLADGVGQSYRQIFQAQADSQPAKKMAPMSADDAKISMANHEATFSDAPARGSQRGAGGGLSSLGGALTPLTATLGELAGEGGGDDYNYPGQRPIHLQAK